MITVVDGQGERHGFPQAVGFRTDEHNNLEVTAEIDGNIRTVRVFNRTDWRRTEIDYG